MIRKIKEGSEYKEAKIISTDDIYIGTDVTSSLGEVINNHTDKIKKLEKWTKWYVKYGGMGSGGGGGGSSTKFGHKVYFKKDSTAKEVTGSVINLWGKGTYIVLFNLTKTQGHSFTLKYFIGEGAKRSLIIPEGSNSVELQISFNTKAIFGYTLTDNSTDDEVEQVLTVIPESYSIAPSLEYKTGGSVIKNNPISYNSLTTKLVGVFNATIFEAVPVYWRLRWKLETENDWHIFENGEGIFEYSSTGETKISKVTKELTFENLQEEEVLGKEITIQLLYGLEQGSYSPTEAGTYTMTIIPEGYYLLVTDPEKRLYLTEPDPETEINKLKKGYLPFYANLCYGSDRSDTIIFELYRKVDNDYILYQTSSPVTLQTNTRVSIADTFKLTVSDSGIFKIVGTSSQGAQTTKYFVVKESASIWDYNQYGNASQGRSSTHFYYDTLSEPFLRTPIEYYKNSYTKNLDVSSLTGDKYNYNIALGFQYDKSNNDNIPFLRLINTDGVNLDIYQNKILWGESTLVDFYYLPKTENSSISDSSLWHLLNINMNYARVNNQGTQFYYELSIYIDGVLEGVGKGTVDSTTSTALSNKYKFKSITINPLESHIIKMNLFEAGFTIISDSASFTEESSDFFLKYNYTYDIYATTYYNKYKSDLGYESQNLDTTAFSTRVEGFKFDEYSIPYTTSENLSSLLSEMNVDGTEKLMKVPIVILCPNETSQTTVGKGNFFKKWFSAIWPEDPSDPETQNPKTLSGYIHYIPANGTGTIAQYLIKDDDQRKVGFTFSIQGSSTRGFGNKNIELAIDQTSEDFETVFTPNFDKDDKGSFLPEKSFTLKADMVDSSTCNNNSIGGFINSNTLPLDEGNCPARSTVIRNHIKNCLTGFPVLVFLHIDNDDGALEDKYYFAGIYNFNLGRKSYYNLGYYKEYDQNILDLMTSAEQGVFKFFDVQKPEYTNYLAVTEISNGNKYFDFSQYDESVLFAASDSDNRSMFSKSDTVYNNEADYRELVSKAIKYISKGGGYIFEKLRKNFEKIGSFDKMIYKLEKDNISLNCVPNYRVQYKRTPESSSYIEDHTDNPATANDLLECIGTTIEEVSHTPKLDLRATVEYYVICMIFGMVDSVLKNLELKSWNKTTIYPAFYDMDTSLGVDNSGNNVDFFAFSDYWSNNVEPIEGYTDRVKAKGVNIYPDFFLENSSYTGYDIPSSYLFAIAKYATMNMMGVSENIPTLSSTESGSGTGAPLSPVNLYSYYRKQGGVLESADKFIETYFSSRLSHIPNSIKNLNYRSKYAKVAYWQVDAVNGKILDVISSSEIRVNQLSDINKFKGTGTNKKRDWLNSRLHLLDSYFNINKDLKYRVRKAELTKSETGAVTNVEWKDVPAEGGAYYYYPRLDGMSITFGDDVTINSQIFQGQTKSTLGISSLLVQAPSFTPIVYSVTEQDPVSYLIGDDTKTTYFNIPLYTVGDQAWNLYGSKNFSYINNLGLFKLNNSSIVSENLEAVNYLPSSEVSTETSGYSLNTPSISAIAISGNKYSGTVSLNSNYAYNRLTSIDFSDSSINCRFTNQLPINTLNLERLKCSGNTISLPNLMKLSTVKLDGANIGTLELPIWKNSISITSNGDTSTSTASYDYHNVSIKNLQLQNIQGKQNVTLKLTAVTSLETVSVSGVSELFVDNCPNLKSIVVDNNLKKISIRNCSGSSTVTDFSIYTGSGESGVIDLSNCPNLTSIDFYNTRKFTKVKINTIVELNSYAFYNCYELKHLESGNGEFTINGVAVFSQCPQLTLRTASGGYPKVLFKSGLTNASSTFNCSGASGRIDFGAAKYFIKSNSDHSRVHSLKNIDYWFYNQPLIGKDTTFSNNYYFEGLSSYTAILSANQAFAYCGLKYWTKELFNFGAEGLIIKGTFYCSEVNVKEDYLQCIGSKISQYTDYEHIKYKFYNTSGTPLTTVNLANIINLPNTTYLAAFYDIDADTVNLKNCFLNATKIVNLYWFMRNCSKWTNLVYDVEDELKSCLWDLTELDEFAECFGVDSPVNGPLNLYYLLPESKWTSLHNINGVGITYNDSFSNFGCSKEISYDNYNSLTELLSRNLNLGALGPIFRDCVVKDCSSSPIMGIPFSQNSPITLAIRTYSGFSAKNKSGENIAVKLDEDFFLHLPNVTNCFYTFSNTWIGNENGLPFDLFRKRSNEIYAEGYVPKRDIIALETDKTTFEYVYYFSTILNTSPSLPTGVDNSKAATEQTEIFSTNINDNNKWLALGTAVPAEGKTNMTRRALWRIKRYKPHKDPSDPTKTTYGEFTLAEKMEQFNDPKAVNVRYTNYNNRVLSDLRGMFYNCSYKVPYFKYSNSFIAEKESYIKDSLGNKYNEYYLNQDCTHLGTYRASTEISDLQGIICEKAVNVTVNGHQFANFNLAHETLQENLSRPFIPTDFFYGVNSACYFENLFCSSIETSQTFSGDTYKCLEGYIPKHLFNNTSQFLSFKDWICNVNIIPIKYKNSNQYVFIPENFVPFILSNIENLFNFHIRVPNYSVQETNNKEFYVMYSNSINVGSNLVSFKDCLPKYVLHGYRNAGIIEDSGNVPEDVTSTNYNFNYHLILVPSLEGAGTLGYVNNYFPSARYQHFISRDVLYILSGQVWDSDYSLNNIPNNGEYTFDEIVYNTEGNHIGINRNFKFPKATNTFGSKSLFKNNVNRISRASLNSNDETYWKSTFGEGLNIID